ncbi:hypothetical protein AK812_SmicGene17817 [Symbiodinium microadriaticum]|uniref:Uncharacterized protein n=1 Tax=Symbiodinium microadriaticum TaxID=2951 RepID=A0A1Q9DWS3_SYMMI|nr:hypothetical protein AK812_SmicGene17817 [Symbiodinium microadriaticum]
MSRSTFQLWPLPLAGRALALGEYGGLGYPFEGHEWSPETSWAYGNVSHTSKDFAIKFLDLGFRLEALLCENWVSAVVYTQWNDIEEEINGLVTYDRIPKLPQPVLLEFNGRLAQAQAECGFGQNSKRRTSDLPSNCDNYCQGIAIEVLAISIIGIFIVSMQL